MSKLAPLVIGITVLGACGPGDPVPEPTLASIQELVFTRRCADPGCHGADFPRQGLELSSSGPALQTLVNVPPTIGDAVATFPARIVPGDPARSFLINKLTGPVLAHGLRMPTGRDPLPEPTIQAIREWIASMPR